MHDRERFDSDEPQISTVPENVPALFVLETVHHGKRRVVAEGVAFTDPEQVVINWRGSSSVELVDTVDELYRKFGNQPRVMWRHERETEETIFTEAEPDELLIRE